ncbi:MAG TPA: multicopper oxidase domain-containing protein [Candidatus Acidoferrum sp.]
MKASISQIAKILAPMVLVFSLAAAANAAVPGIGGTTFNLTAQQAYLNQPDGEAVYSWGYGCLNPTGVTFLPAEISGASCPMMQVPGPTLIVTEGQSIIINLTNQLPAAAGNTSILFPGFNVTTSCSGTTPAGVQGLLTCEAAPGATVQYTFTASAAGTHPYYSGTQGDLQIEMGLYGAIVVLPASVPANCTTGYHAANLTAKAFWGESDFRLPNLSGQRGAAYDHPGSCYDREYLFQWAEMDQRIHRQAEAQVKATVASGVCPTTLPASSINPACSLSVQTEPYHPAYFLINGRSMPDLMDPNYASEYPHQPYNGNPHMHPGELTLVRTIGQGRWQHPFHEHANHVRILSRDGNLILSSNPTQISYNTPGGTAASGPGLAGILMFNTDTTPGESFDGIFYFTGRGLNWDPYGHHPGDTNDPLGSLGCTPDANGYNTAGTAVTALNFFEWCQDHNKPVQVAPFGDVAAGGPATLPDPNVFTNGAWYGGTPYLGPDASLRGAMPACVGNPYGTPTGNPTTPSGAPGTPAVNTANCTTLNPANVQLNPANERGWAFMWHSHNEREITTNNVFPGGMLMMMLVDTREFVIDETL